MNSERIKQLAAEIGFDLCGITGAEIIPEAAEAYVCWIKAGNQADMDYLARDPGRRMDPSRLLEGTRSVIMVGMSYYVEDKVSSVPRGHGRISRYARGRDYHKVIEKKLKTLVGRITSEMADIGESSFRSFVDYAPILERAYARKAGLGYLGLNSMLINRDLGSWFVLGGLLTTIDLQPDPASAIDHGDCTGCTACIDACPTGAILADGHIDSRKCLSYLTIESKDEIPETLASAMGDRIFGCDTCQEVCPHNVDVQNRGHAEFQPESGVGETVDAEMILKMRTQAEFLDLVAGTSLTRPKLFGLQRNARIVLVNNSSPTD